MICFYLRFIALVVASWSHHIGELVQIVVHWMRSGSLILVSEKQFNILLERCHWALGTSFSLLGPKEEISGWIKSIIDSWRVVAKSILLGTASSSFHGFHRKALALDVFNFHMQVESWITQICFSALGALEILSLRPHLRHVLPIHILTCSSVHVRLWRSTSSPLDHWLLSHVHDYLNL